MELSSKIKRTWKLIFIGSLLGCLVLLLYLDQNGRSLSFLTARNTIQQLPLYQDSEAPTISPKHGLSEAPLWSPLSNPPNPALTLNGQPEAHFSTIMANQPVQVDAPMPTMMANPPVQVDGPVTAKAPVQDVLLHDETSANIISTSTTFGQTPEMNELKSNNQISMNEIEKSENKSDERKCNFFEGKWVYKEEEKPSYDSIKCPFIEEKFSCQKNGRPDNEYEKWSWKPNDCDLPLFNGREMLERLRNKRVIIVGDSLNRNMWESLSCLLYASIPSSRAQVEATPSEYKFFKAKDYNVTIEFHWSPFLVKFDNKHKSGKNVLVIDKLSRNSKLWRGADVMVFNSAHWWTHKGKFRKWDLLEYKGQLLREEIPLKQAYEIGLKTWATWIQNTVDSKKTMVFFRSVSAQHNGKPYCYDVKTPINNDSPYKNNFPKSMINVAESIIKGMNKTPVIYLNIIKLSEYRIDAHPSIFRSSQGKIYATKYKSLIRTFADCSHWCLPGLPDTWNHLLYTTLFYNTTWNMKNS